MARPESHQKYGVSRKSEPPPPPRGFCQRFGWQRDIIMLPLRDARILLAARMAARHHSVASEKSLIQVLKTMYQNEVSRSIILKLNIKLFLFVKTWRYLYTLRIWSSFTIEAEISQRTWVSQCCFIIQLQQWIYVQLIFALNFHDIIP